MFSRFIKSSKSCLSLSGNLIDFFEQALKFDWSSCFNKAGEKNAIKSTKWCNLWKQSALQTAKQIAKITSDLKMDEIKSVIGKGFSNWSSA